MSPRGGISVWLWLVMAMAQSALAANLWSEWREFKVIEASYPPEILAVTHFAIPPYLVRYAIWTTLVALGCWALAIWKAERS
jgi:hypothetical protein